MVDETTEEETQKKADETAEAEEPAADSTDEAVAETAAADSADDEPAGEESSAEAAAEDDMAEAEAAEPAAEPAAEQAAATEQAAAEPAPEETVETAESPAEAAPMAAAPEFTYEELHAMNVAQLRDVAAGIEHDAVHGYTTMHKEHLLPAICTALGIEAHEHHEVVGIDKVKVKAQIRELKQKRDEAEAAGDSVTLKRTRRRIRGLKRKIRKATV